MTENTDYKDFLCDYSFYPCSLSPHQSPFMCLGTPCILIMREENPSIMYNFNVSSVSRI